MERTGVVIVGAGITGLAIAFWLKKKGTPFVLLEAAGAAGGKISTERRDGFALDFGPITCARNSSLDHLLLEAGLLDQVIHPSIASKKRFIFSNGRLRAVSPHPLNLLTNSIVPFASKLTILKDLRQTVRPLPEDESVADFIRRHFDETILRKIFDPVLSGIYAGNPEKLSILSVLPLLKKMETENGSVIRGLWRNRKALNLRREIISFSGGFQTLINRLVDRVGDSLQLGTSVCKISISSEGVEVALTGNRGEQKIVCSKIILATPAPEAGRLLTEVDQTTAGTLQSILYNPVGQLYCSVGKKDITGFRGFGFLTPSSENTSLIGAVHNSAMFPAKTPDDRELFTLFFRFRPGDDESAARRALESFRHILKIQSDPQVIHRQAWPQAIPQPEVGHLQKLRVLGEFERKFPTIRLAGSYISGVSVGDCVLMAADVAAG